MADTVISFLLENLSRLIAQEIDLQLRVKEEADSLKNELKLIQAFLKDFAFGKRNNEQELTKQYIKQITDTAQQAEDIIDTYVAKIWRQRTEGGFFEKLKSSVSQLTTRHEVAGKIAAVRLRFKELYEKRNDLGIQISQSGDFFIDEHLRRRNRRLVDDADVIGLDEEAKKMIERVTGNEVRRDVIAIVGMGGIGKTTLARKVYNDSNVSRLFDIRAWIVVSQDYKVREVLIAIIRSVAGLKGDLKEMSDEELESEAFKYLRGSRYLIVLDDVWKPEFWDDFDSIFSNNPYGSRVIVTTRNLDVARRVSPVIPPHDVPFLDKNDSWKLLSKRVFQGDECPTELVELGEEMAKRCRGLPLAIVVLAGILLTKKRTRHHWSTISSSVSSILTEPNNQCSEILSLSYDNLSHHLKPCFLYSGLFPEDSEILARQLIRLWMAEGFVQQTDKKRVEIVAEEYLEELINRNLIQVTETRFDGVVKACRIHDLLRDLCISKAKQENFLQVRGSSLSPSSPCDSRRLGIHSNTEKYLAAKHASNLRTLLCFGLDDSELGSKQWKVIYNEYKLLRVLDLWAVDVESIPSEVGKLIHLRYLKLKSRKAPDFPSSISKLWNLQTLDVVAPSIEGQQINIWKMLELRHLYFRGQAVLPEPPKEMARNSDSVLSNIQTLSFISPESCTEIVFSKVPNLVKLGIYGDLEKHKGVAFAGQQSLTSLQTLKLVRDRRCASMYSLPSWKEFSPSLIKLTLSKTRLSRDPMQTLGKLPNLQVLKLIDDAYVGASLVSFGDEFTKLQVLKLVNLEIKNWEMSDGSMPRLESVVIKRCGGLVSLPTNLPQMFLVKEMELWWPSAEVAKQARGIENTRGKEHFKLFINQSETK
ncbi:Rx, N-terminal [Dillenia turbinata]|uniref:Rx, N-terminal n=1 Tax=Dillenia turbinata TaxID=194707 RepID=A0AAN8ZQ23_9MAGN